MTNNDFKNHEFEIIQDAWAAYKKYYLGSDPDDDAFWDGLVKEMAAINNKYKTKLCAGLTDLFLQDIERRSKVKMERKNES